MVIRKSYFEKLLSTFEGKTGSIQSITATARKIATIVYKMLKNRSSYFDLDQDYYEERHQSCLVNNLKRKAKGLSFELVSTSEGQMPTL